MKQYLEEISWLFLILSTSYVKQSEAENLVGQKKLDKNGFFWTSSENYKDCSKLMDRVINIKYESWLKIIKGYKELCPYNEGNKVLKKIIYKGIN